MSEEDPTPIPFWAKKKIIAPFTFMFAVLSIPFIGRLGIAPVTFVVSFILFIVIIETTSRASMDPKAQRTLRSVSRGIMVGALAFTVAAGVAFIAFIVIIISAFGHGGLMGGGGGYGSSK